MLDTGNPWQIKIHRAGGLAMDALRNANAGHVAAVFEHSFYIDTPAGLFCVGNERMYAGPLNVITAAPETTDWRASGLSCNLPVSLSARKLCVGPQLSFDLTDLKPWAPQRWPSPPAVINAARGLSGFRAVARAKVRTDGLGAFIFHDDSNTSSSPSGRLAGPAISGLRATLRRTFQTGKPQMPECCDLETLMGIGPGLTPAGDDFLGGMMMALRALSFPVFCADLWAGIEPRAETAGNAVSLAHLRGAAEGYAAAAVHDLILAILSGDVAAMPSAIEELDRIGHSSGWDIMAGAVTVIDAWLRASQPAPSN